MKNLKKISVVNVEQFKTITGGNNGEPSFPGNFTVQNITVTPNVSLNENVAVGTFGAAYPITNNVGVYANTSIATDYNIVVNPSNSIGIYANFPF